MAEYSRKSIAVLGLVWSVIMLASLPVRAQDAEPAADTPRADVIVRSGLPVPRFASLRSGEVNVRTGPGVRYPVDWVFVRAGMPVEITAEFDTWRRIRDWDGTQGWVHQSMLSGRRMAILRGQPRSLRAEPQASADAVAQVEPGVIGRLRKCLGVWCQVEMGGYKGWLARTDLWGVYETEDVGE